jgi:hypothetical protein
MKNILQTGLLAVGVLLVTGATGNAQVSRQYSAHVPFDFVVGDKLMKSGDYTIVPASGTTDLRAILLEDRNTLKASVVGQTAITSSNSIKKGRLVFAKIGDRWLLSEITTTGFELRLKPRQENSTLAKVVTSRSVDIDR